MEPVTFINCFEVPAGREEEFLGLWTQVNQYMQTQPGYLSHRLHRSVQPSARFRFVNIALWESAESWQAAHGEGFRELVAQPVWADFTSVPALYEVVLQNER